MARVTTQAQGLRQNWNPASLYHMNNPATAGLLVHARMRSRRPPQVVMLGSLSDERNTEELAVKAVRDGFAEASVDVDFRLQVAPKYAASRAIRAE